ncbi:MAG: THUMP domain-containing protein, partial [Firmicutes bacterium]|nr:THUMP domain-containing protein [Bacillota bacterium]
MNFELAATCLFGLEHTLGEEIDSLGYSRTETIDGRVYFKGDESAIARMNIFSRTAERVMIVVGQFEALSFDELFEGTKALPWELFIGCDDKFPVKGHSVKSTLFSVPDCQRIINKAVADRLSMKYGVSTLPETGVLCQVVFFILKNKVSLMIDT